MDSYNKIYYNKNRDSELEPCKECTFQNRGKITEHIKIKSKSDSKFKLARYMRN